MRFVCSPEFSSAYINYRNVAVLITCHVYCNEHVTVDSFNLFDVLIFGRSVTKRVKELSASLQMR